jgi:glycosyltransferase involved in cell wall biosynthesis
MDVPEGEVMNVQKMATILLLPLIPGGSISSIPSKLPNYMLSAKAIIAAVDKDSDTANVIKDSGCGWVVDPNDRVSLINLLEKVVNLPITDINEFGLRGLEYAQNNFSRDISLNKLVNIIMSTHKSLN